MAVLHSVVPERRPPKPDTTPALIVNTEIEESEYHLIRLRFLIISLSIFVTYLRGATL